MTAADRHTPMPLAYDDARTILAMEACMRKACELTRTKHVPQYPEDVLERARAVVLAEHAPRTPGQIVNDPPRQGFIYIVKRKKLVKIGFSVQPEVRIKALERQGGESLEIVAVFPGSYEDESGLHRRFRHLRGIGEWFSIDAELRKFMRSARAKIGAVK